MKRVSTYSKNCQQRFAYKVDRRQFQRERYSDFGNLLGFLSVIVNRWGGGREYSRHSRSEFLLRTSFGCNTVETLLTDTLVKLSDNSTYGRVHKTLFQLTPIQTLYFYIFVSEQFP